MRVQIVLFFGEHIKYFYVNLHRWKWKLKYEKINRNFNTILYLLFWNAGIWADHCHKGEFDGVLRWSVYPSAWNQKITPTTIDNITKRASFGIHTYGRAVYIIADYPGWKQHHFELWCLLSGNRSGITRIYSWGVFDKINIWRS